MSNSVHNWNRKNEASAKGLLAETEPVLQTAGPFELTLGSTLEKSSDESDNLKTEPPTESVYQEANFPVFNRIAEGKAEIKNFNHIHQHLLQEFLKLCHRFNMMK